MAFVRHRPASLPNSAPRSQQPSLAASIAPVVDDGSFGDGSISSSSSSSSSGVGGGGGGAEVVVGTSNVNNKSLLALRTDLPIGPRALTVAENFALWALAAISTAFLGATRWKPRLLSLGIPPLGLGCLGDGGAAAAVTATAAATAAATATATAATANGVPSVTWRGLARLVMTLAIEVSFVSRQSSGWFARDHWKRTTIVLALIYPRHALMRSSPSLLCAP